MISTQYQALGICQWTVEAAQLLTWLSGSSRSPKPRAGGKFSRPQARQGTWAFFSHNRKGGTNNIIVFFIKGEKRREISTTNKSYRIRFRNNLASFDFPECIATLRPIEQARPTYRSLMSLNLVSLFFLVEAARGPAKMRSLWCRFSGSRE